LAVLELQRTAGNAAVCRALKTAGEPATAVRLLVIHPEPVLARTPVEKVLKFGVKWLSKRAIKTVSKHIARHGRMIAGRAIHSVFKSPKKIKQMLELTVKEAAELAGRNAKAPAEQVLEEGGVRIARQTTGTPGKFRWMIQREFKEPIGTRGERILRVILDQSGRIVTAFPAERMAALGLSVGGAALLESRSAEAAEQLRTDAEQRAKRLEEKESQLHWEEFIPFIGDIYGGSLNEGEDEMLRQQRYIQVVINDVIAEVEHHEQKTLGPDQRKNIEELIRAGMGAPYHAEEADSSEGASIDSDAQLDAALAELDAAAAVAPDTTSTA
jgi:hypothetical protein